MLSLEQLKLIRSFMSLPAPDRLDYNFLEMKFVSATKIMDKEIEILTIADNFLNQNKTSDIKEFFDNFNKEYTEEF